MFFVRSPKQPAGGLVFKSREIVVFELGTSREIKFFRHEGDLILHECAGKLQVMLFGNQSLDKSCVAPAHTSENIQITVTKTVNDFLAGSPPELMLNIHIKSVPAIVGNPVATFAINVVPIKLADQTVAF